MTFIKSNVCKHCGSPLGSQAEHAYEVRDYPYNPDWSVTRLDSGIFCSAEHLVAYLRGGAS